MTFSYKTHHTSSPIITHIRYQHTPHTTLIYCKMKIILIGHRPPRWSHAQLWSTPFWMQKCIRWDRKQLCGQLVPLDLIEKTHLVGCEVKDDSTDGCQVCFAKQECTTGVNSHVLDGSLLRITQVFLPDSENRSMRALYHHINVKYPPEWFLFLAIPNPT
jgi:hypothetical protein